MAYTSWRGTVGLIKPTKRPGVLEQNIRLLPEGIGVIPTFLGFNGSHGQFAEAMPHYDLLLAELAEQEVDLVSAGGEPPFMLQGVKGEQKTVAAWEKKYKLPILSTGMTACAAMRALKIKNMVLIRATDWDKKGHVARYFTEGGFKVLGENSLEASWEGISEISAEQVYRFTKETVLKHKKCDGIYMMGSIFRALSVIDVMEQDFGIPIAAAAALYPWSIQKHLHVHQPIQGHGTLLRELP